MYSTNRRQACALGSDNLHELLPGANKRFSSIVLEPCGQVIDVDARRRELIQHCFAIAAVGRHDLAYIPVIGKGFQSSLGHGVYREWRSKRLYI